MTGGTHQGSCSPHGSWELKKEEEEGLRDSLREKFFNDRTSFHYAQCPKFPSPGTLQ
jgi:hypothetical protein